MSTPMRESPVCETIEDYYQYPDEQGHFGRFGGMFAVETLMRPLQELRKAYQRYGMDAGERRVA